MAGIGFRLQRILRNNTYRGLMEAYFYSALVSSGPWLLSILGLVLIDNYAGLFVGRDQALYFRAMVTYTYMGALVLTGPFQLNTTRFIADRLYVNDQEAMLPCFHFVGSLTVGGAALVAVVFYSLGGAPVLEIVAGMILFQSVCLTWIAMIFLSAAKDYLAIVRAFALGYGLGVVASIWGAREAGFPGLLMGFVAGQVVLTLLLCVRVRKEFPSPRAWDSLVTRHWRRMPWLFWIGLWYNLGVWIDKILFWYSPHGIHVRGLFNTTEYYDTALYMAYLSIVPAMALFLIRIETGFYKQYAAFFSVITQRGDLKDIISQKASMVEALRLSVARLLKLQGGVTLVLLFIAPQLLQRLGVPVVMVPTFRLALLAAFVQVMLLFLFIILLYFDWQKEVGLISALFCLGNAAFTLVSFHYDTKYHGLGYLAGCLFALVVGLFILESRVAEVEYDTFTRQPMRG